MKKLTALLLLISCVVASAVDIYPVAVGNSPNNNQGDTLRTAFQKLNTNDFNLASAISNLVAGSANATNVTTTNSVRFGIFKQNNSGVLEFFGLEQGTNAVLYRNGSNIVINSQPAGVGSPADRQYGSESLTNVSAFLAAGNSNRLAVLNSRGEITNAFKTYYFDTNQSPILSNLIAAASSGDLIILGPGRFNIGSQSLRPPVGVRIRGQGMHSTTISGTAPLFSVGPLLTINSSNQISDIGFDLAAAATEFQAGLGSVWSVLNHPPPTNFLVERCYIPNGETDAFYITQSNYFSGIVRECYFKSKWDVFVQSAAAAGTYTNYMEVWNSTIIADFSGTTNPDALSAARAVAVRHSLGTLKLYNCTIISTNAPASYAMRGSGAGPYTPTYVYGGDIQAAGTNSASKADNTLTVSTADAPFFFFGAPVTSGEMEVGSVGVWPNTEHSNVVARGSVTVTSGVTVGGDIDATTGTVTADDVAANGIFALLATPAMAAIIGDGNDVTNHPTVSVTELGYLDGVTSAIQTQFGNKADLTWANSISNLVQTKQHGTAALTNIAGLPSMVFTNVPLGGTNISVRTTGGTNFIDSTLQLISPTLSNGTIKPLVVGATAAAAGATNITGRIRGLEAGSNVTLTENGSNVVIAASVSGSGIATNGNQFGANTTVTIKDTPLLTNVYNFGTLTATNPANGGATGFTALNELGFYGDNGSGAISIYEASGTTGLKFTASGNAITSAGTPRSSLGTAAAPFNDVRGTNVYAENALIQRAVLTNTLRIAATNLNLAGTNLVADGNIANIFTNAIHTSGITNIVVTNILDGQTIEIGLWVTNGTTVQLCTAPAVQIPDAWYTDGTAIQINTNGFTWIQVKRYGGFTNVTQVLTPSFAWVPGPAQSDSTNFATRVITRLLDAVLTNLVGTVANNVTNENSTVLQINSGTLTLSPGNVSNLVNNTTLDFQPGNVITNIGGLKGWVWTNYVQTVSNFVFSFNTNYVELKNQTNVVFTNLVEEATAIRGNIEVHIHNTTGVTMGLVWPAYGAQHGYFFNTNANNAVLATTSLASGSHLVASFSCFGTNIFGTATTWP